MQRIAFGAVLGAMLAASGTVLAQAPSWTPPPGNQRCPSKWGAGDERGSANHMKPQTVLNAVKLIKTGEVIELGYVLNANMPFFGTRRLHQIALVVNGVHLLENLKLDELAAKSVYEFAFIMEPLKIQGGTGSTVAPVAVR